MLTSFRFKNESTVAALNGVMEYINMTNTEARMRKKYTNTDILIDTGSTCSVFRNPNMLLDIKASKNVMRTVSNDGYQDSKLRGLFPSFFRMWLNERSLMNILAMSDVTSKYKVIMDSMIENCIDVHMGEGNILKFKEVESGLYMLMNKFSANLNKKKVSDYSFLTLVKSNKAKFTNR